MDATDYAQIEVLENDTIESVARRLAAAAPASAIYDGVDVRVEVGQAPEDIVRQYLRFRQGADIRKALGQFAISMVEIVATESPGPGVAIDPHKAIKDPRPGTLYVLWERRRDFSIGNVAVVAAQKSIPGAPTSLHLQHGLVVSALGSLLVELYGRVAASEARISALEALADRNRKS